MEIESECGFYLVPISGWFRLGIYFIWVVTNCQGATPACPIFVYRDVFSALLAAQECSKMHKAKEKKHQKLHLPSRSPEIIPAMCQLHQ